MLWLLALGISITLVGVIIMILIPNTRTLIASMGTVLALLFSAVNVFISLDEARERRSLQRISSDNEYWFRIMDRLGTDPLYEDMHNKIYDSDIPSHIHAMFSMMMQVVGALITSHSMGLTDIHGPWRHAITKWISHPLFPAYWKNNRHDYNDYHNRYIDNILSETDESLPGSSIQGQGDSSILSG